MPYADSRDVRKSPVTGSGDVEENDCMSEAVRGTDGGTGSEVDGSRRVMLELAQMAGTELRSGGVESWVITDAGATGLSLLGSRWEIADARD